MVDELNHGTAPISIALSEVAHISRLARLGLSSEELARLGAQLQVIVAAVGELSRADISAVGATAQVGGLRNVLRSDVAEPGLSAAEALANAAATESGFFRVPAIQ